MKAKNFIPFAVSLLCLAVGAACHGLRTSGDAVKFRLGVIIGVAMIIAALCFAVAGVVILVKNRNK